MYTWPLRWYIKCAQAEYKQSCRCIQRYIRNELQNCNLPSNCIFGSRANQWLGVHRCGWCGWGCCSSFRCPCGNRSPWIHGLRYCRRKFCGVLDGILRRHCSGWVRNFDATISRSSRN